MFVVFPDLFLRTAADSHTSFHYGCYDARGAHRSPQFTGAAQLQAVSEPRGPRQVRFRRNDVSSEAAAAGVTLKSCASCFSHSFSCSDSMFGRESLAWTARTLQAQAVKARRRISLSLLLISRRPHSSFKPNGIQVVVAAACADTNDASEWLCCLSSLLQQHLVK